MNAQLNIARIEPRVAPDLTSDAGWLLTTMFVRPGKGLKLTDSNVFCPISTVLPCVIVLKCFKSSDICHGKALFNPITLFLATAAIIEIILQLEL